MNIFEQRIRESKQYIPAVRQALLDTYFSSYNQDFLQTEAGLLDIENNVFRRHDHALRHVIPWLNHQIDLAGRRVLEIGCGTGSSTAALAPYVRSIEGYDIHPQAVAGARKRLEIMGLNNVRLHVIREDELVQRVTDNAKHRYDIILLFAVLEHQTIEERHENLVTCWNLLAPDGIMAVIDTPNILHYFDLHTSKLPFLHMLPTRLYAKYAARSPRPAFARSFADQARKTDAELDEQVARWGRGASYHDFELALGPDYHTHLVADGFEPEILSWFPCTVEEELLRWYVEHKKFNIPPGFTRCVLNLIFKKTINPRQPAGQPAFAPPTGVSFAAPGQQQKIRDLEQQLEEIYRSKTWRAGSLMATPYRMLRRLFQK